MRNILKIGIPKVAYHDLTLMVCNLCQPRQTITINCNIHIINHHLDEIFQNLPMQEVTQQRDCCRKDIKVNVPKFVFHHVEDHGPIIFDTVGNLSFLITSFPVGQRKNDVEPCNERMFLQTISKEESTNFETGYEFETYFIEGMRNLKEKRKILRKYALYNDVEGSTFKLEIDKSKRYLEFLKDLTLIEKQKVAMQKKYQRQAIKVKKRKVHVYYLNVIERLKEECDGILLSIQKHFDQMNFDFNQLDKEKKRFQMKTTDIENYIEQRYPIDKQLENGESYILINNEKYSDQLSTTALVSKNATKNLENRIFI